MCTEYTNMIDKSLVQFCEEDEMEALDFLTNPSSFRSFGEGLTTILKQTDYAGDLNNNEEKSKYLLHKLQEIHSTTGIKTIRSWFDGSRRPKIQNASREKIYEICFALNLSITDVEWFFHHVYFDRCFNFHNRTEALYAFCFVNNLPYGKAKEIIHTIENQEAKPVEQNDVGINYTKFVKQQIM